jgi:hypothetical protein
LGAKGGAASSASSHSQTKAGEAKGSDRSFVNDNVLYHLLGFGGEVPNDSYSYFLN